MQSKLIQIKTVRFWKEKDALCLVNELGESQIVGANLIRHVLEIPYTKKDGTFVSKEQILSMKQRPKPKQSQFKPRYLKPVYP